MRWVYFAIIAVLGVIFWRKDTQLIDLIFNANLKWSLAAALFLFGILAGQWILRRERSSNRPRVIVLSLMALGLLGLMEYSVEWSQKNLVKNNETILLSAASVESVSQHFVPMVDGLFETDVQINDIQTQALIDTGASLVVLNFQTALDLGLDVESLNYTTPVRTASGVLDVAKVTLDDIRVGPSITAQNVEAAITPKGIDHSNLLGVSFLSQLDEAMVKDNQIILRQSR